MPKNKKAKIYTRKGDDGYTSTGMAKRESKDSALLEAMGTLDELNSALGVVVASTHDRQTKTALSSVQKDLFDVGSDLFWGNGMEDKIGPNQVKHLEKIIDKISSRMDPLHHFILPGGTLPAAYLHLARTICRRAERRIVTWSRQRMTNPWALKYVNRLSDLLFEMAREANQ